MKKIAYYSEIIIILTIFWVILVESFNVVQILAGMFVGLTAIIFTDNYLLLGDYKYSYKLKMWVLVKFLCYLVYEIYLSGIVAIYRMLSNKVNIGIIDVETKLDNDLSICILANSITLTPGTVTLDKRGNILKVLCLSCRNDGEGYTPEVVKSKLEEILLEGS